MYPSIEVNNLGESDFIIAHKPPKAPEMCWQWLKNLFVCLVSFLGAAFAIMTFNNDVNVGDVLGQVYFQVMGRQPDGFWAYGSRLQCGAGRWHFSIFSIILQ